MGIGISVFLLAVGAILVGIVSVVYGALVALAQTNFKRMVAYTSVNHMGYIVLAVGAAGLVADDTAQARSVAVTGAVTQMVSHGLITGALFLMVGMIYDRTHTRDMDEISGIARVLPWTVVAFIIGGLVSMGMPGFSGFIAKPINDDVFPQQLADLMEGKEIWYAGERYANQNISKP